MVGGLSVPYRKRFSDSYTSYILSDRWKIKRQSYFGRNGRICQACGSRSNLVVHHLSYTNFMNEPLSDLLGVCQSCHREIHRLHRKSGRKDLRVVSLEYVRTRRLTTRKR